MEEIATRLKTTSEDCLKAYEAWSDDERGVATTGPLQDALHELRKVTARLEIELAVSERDENGKPMPLPMHRAHGSNKGNSQLRSNNQPNNRKPQQTRRPAKSNNKPAPSGPSDNSLPAFISGGDTSPKPTVKPMEKPTATKKAPAAKPAEAKSE